MSESKQAYIEFVRALDQFAQAGGGDHIPDYVDRYLLPEGPARRFISNEMKNVKALKLKASGFGTLRNIRLLDTTDLDKAPPEVHWSACLDQRSVSITQEGKPYGNKPDFLVEKVQFRFDEPHDQWRVFDMDVRGLESGQDCEDAK